MRGGRTWTQRISHAFEPLSKLFQHPSSKTVTERRFWDLPPVMEEFVLDVLKEYGRTTVSA